MAWGDAAAEQYEKDQPSTVRIPDPKPEHYVVYNGVRYDVPQETPAEMVLDDAERRGE